MQTDPRFAAFEKLGEVEVRMRLVSGVYQSDRPLAAAWLEMKSAENRERQDLLLRRTYLWAVAATVAAGVSVAVAVVALLHAW